MVRNGKRSKDKQLRRSKTEFDRVEICLTLTFDSNQGHVGYLNILLLSTLLRKPFSLI